METINQELMDKLRGEEGYLNVLREGINKAIKEDKENEKLKEVGMESFVAMNNESKIKLLNLEN